MYNNQEIIGYVGRDADQKQFSDGNTVANFSVATNRRVKLGSEYKDETTWHNVSVYGKPDKFVALIKKGAIVRVSGFPQIVDKGGKTYINLLANDVLIVKYAEGGGGATESYAPAKETKISDSDEDAMPF